MDTNLERPAAAAETDGTNVFGGAFLFLAALLGALSIHDAVIFNEPLPTARQAFALANALLLAAAIVLLTRGARAEEARAFPPALAKAAGLALLFVALLAAEETAAGVWSGTPPAAAAPSFATGALQSILISAAILFVALAPLLSLVEIGRALPAGKLRALLFGRALEPLGADAHVERHFLNSETVRDVVIGMADGLTVPFALAAGISAAIASTHVVVTAGFAEIVAGATAMGLGGYLAARSEQEHFQSEEKREYLEIEKVPEHERAELRDIFSEYGLKDRELESVVDTLAADKKRWVDFMMRFELGLERPDPKRAPISAATIAGAYFVGGLIPLAPYIIESDIKRALLHSALFTGVALLVFGAVKGKVTGADPVKSGFQTLLVGGLAAGAAYYLASLFG